MTALPDRNTFESAYAGQAPWDIGRPQKPFLDVADRIADSVLDAGCGTGENSLHFAGRGCAVTVIDFPGSSCLATSVATFLPSWT